MRGIRIIQAEKRLIFQTTGGVCLAHGERAPCEISVSLTGLKFYQKTRGAGSVCSQHPASFRLKRLISSP